VSAGGVTGATAGSAGGARGRLRELAPFGLLVVALALAALLGGRPPVQGDPLDPRSSGPLGTKALVDVLGELGARVEVVAGVPEADTDVALLLADLLDDGDREALLAWVREGGRLVAADSTSPLTPEVVGVTSLGITTPSLAPGDCPLAALGEVGRVGAPGGSVYAVDEGAVGCYPRGEGSWLVARAEGEGTVVAVGGPATFTNIELGAQDNALLAAALLIGVRDGGAGRPTVAVLETPPPGAGDATLTDLIDPSVGSAFLQLLIAFGVVVLWRSRRLGRPVVERLAVEVPGSELVVAVGNLLQTARRPGRAAALLRADARRLLAERLGLPVTAPAEVLADAAASRTGLRRSDVLAVLDDGETPVPGAPGGPQTDDAQLVALAQSAERVRRATFSTRPANPANRADGTVTEGAPRVH